MAEESNTIEIPAADFTATDVELAESVRHMLINDLLKVENASALRAFAFVALLEQMVEYCATSGASPAAVRSMTAGELAAAVEALANRSTDG